MLNPGDKLGPYEILEPIGQGGMGAVYRARDTRLDRDVAVKVSDQRFGERFEREARVISSLNHPNICHLYDVGDNYLVMELVEGQTLAERIKQGPIPLEESLKIAHQIADALDAAHEKGVVHRDLKPGNVMINADGPSGSMVKVLDFGLAKAGPRTASGSSAGDDPDLSPTISMAATQAGVILGTAAYMAPEQAKGKPVDKRADIWAFGVVLCEMITGRKLFAGDDLTETLAAVVRDKPDFSGVPHELHRLLAKCLEKDPRNRLRDIGDAWGFLDDEAAEASEAAAAGSLPTGKTWLWPIGAGVVGLALGALAFFATQSAPPAPEPLSFVIDPPAGYDFSPTASTEEAISPDGQLLAFVARSSSGQSPQSLWLRPMDSLEAREVPGTENARLPFWSPDSKSIGFYAGNSLRRVDVVGGPVQTLSTTSNTADGGSWGLDNTILFSTNEGIYRIPASGGTAEEILAGDAARHYSHPQFLIGGRSFLVSLSSSDENLQGVYVASLDDPGEAQRVVATQGSKAAYAPGANGSPGHLLWMSGRTLMAQPFDPASLSLEGNPIPLADQIQGDGSNLALQARESFAATTGLLVYRTAGSSGALTQMSWVRADGSREKVGAPADIGQLRLSPDGQRIALAKRVSGNIDLWIYEFARGSELRLTFDTGLDGYPVWSPDGRSLAYASGSGAYAQLFRVDAAGGGQIEQLRENQLFEIPYDWSQDGKFLLFGSQTATATLGTNTNRDIWVLPLDDRENAIPFLTTPFDESNARFSPDGKWIAYQSNESGQNEVYIRAFPGGPPGQWPVSVGGSGGLIWSRDGKQIFYATLQRAIMAVDVRLLEDRVDIGSPREVLPPNPRILTGDVTPDGKNWLILEPAEVEESGSGESPSNQIKAILNWQSLLEK